MQVEYLNAFCGYQYFFSNQYECKQIQVTSTADSVSTWQQRANKWTGERTRGDDPTEDRAASPLHTRQNRPPQFLSSVDVLLAHRLNHKIQTKPYTAINPSLSCFLLLRFIQEQKKSHMAAATASVKSSLLLPSPISDFSGASVSVSTQVTKSAEQECLC